MNLWHGHPFATLRAGFGHDSSTGGTPVPRGQAGVDEGQDYCRRLLLLSVPYSRVDADTVAPNESPVPGEQPTTVAPVEQSIADALNSIKLR